MSTAIPRPVGQLSVYEADDGTIYALDISGRAIVLAGPEDLGPITPVSPVPGLTGTNFYWEFKWISDGLSAPKTGAISGNQAWPKDCTVLSVNDVPTTPSLNVDPVLRMLDFGSKVAAWDPSQADSWIKWQVTAPASHQSAGYTYIPVQVLSMGTQATGNFGWTVVDFLFLI